MYVDLYQNLATKNNWKTKEVVIKRGLLAKMRAISDVVFLKMFLICKPRLLIFHNFQKLRKHNTSTGTRNQISISTSMLRNKCKINAPALMRGNEINSGFLRPFRASEF